MRGRNRSLCHPPAKPDDFLREQVRPPAVSPAFAYKLCAEVGNIPGTGFDLKLHEYVKILARRCYMRAHESFNQTRDTWYWTARALPKDLAGWLVWCLIYLAPPTKRQRRRATRPTLFCQSNKTGTVGPPISIGSNLIIKRRQFSTKFVPGSNDSTVALPRDCNFNATSRCIACVCARAPQARLFCRAKEETTTQSIRPTRKGAPSFNFDKSRMLQSNWKWETRVCFARVFLHAGVETQRVVA